MLDGDKTVIEVARSLGLSESVLFEWVKRASEAPDAAPARVHRSPDREGAEPVKARAAAPEPRPGVRAEHGEELPP